jgi:hypothetical protein
MGRICISPTLLSIAGADLDGDGWQELISLESDYKTIPNEPADLTWWYRCIGVKNIARFPACASAKSCNPWPRLVPT